MIGGITRYCPQCGTAFAETGRHRMYCSQVCRKKFNYKKGNDPPKTGNLLHPEVRVCKTCGELFVTNYSGKRYCSDKCRFHPDIVLAKMRKNNGNV